MEYISVNELAAHHQELLQETVDHIQYSLNKVTNPQLAAALYATNGSMFFGNNIFLSNNTLLCAEANAMGQAVSKGHRQFRTLYLISHRADKEPSILTPCGNCRQWLHDFSIMENKSIVVICATSKLDTALITHSNELLPAGFLAAGLERFSQ